MPANKNLPENLSFEERFNFDPQTNRFYVNFQNYSIKDTYEINKIEFIVATKLSHLEKRVAAIVNYENFTINEELLIPYSRMVNRLMEHFYSDVSRYTSSEDLKEDLEKGFKGANISPNIFQTSSEAEKALKA